MSKYIVLLCLVLIPVMAFTQPIKANYTLLTLQWTDTDSVRAIWDRETPGVSLRLGAGRFLYTCVMDSLTAAVTIRLWSVHDSTVVVPYAYLLSPRRTVPDTLIGTLIINQSLWRTPFGRSPQYPRRIWK